MNKLLIIMMALVLPINLFAAKYYSDTEIITFCKIIGLLLAILIPLGILFLLCMLIVKILCIIAEKLFGGY